LYSDKHIKKGTREMKFFGVVGFTLFLIAFFNLMDVGVQMALREPVYACSEVTKQDPINVQKKCRK
jgi:hypothetical protein